MSLQALLNASKDLLTSKEAARQLKSTTGTLAVWRCNGRHALPFVKVGRAVRYRPEDIDAFIAANLRATGVTETIVGSRIANRPKKGTGVTAANANASIASNLCAPVTAVEGI